MPRRRLVQGGILAIHVGGEVASSPYTLKAHVEASRRDERAACGGSKRDEPHGYGAGELCCRAQQLVQKVCAVDVVLGVDDCPVIEREADGS